MELYFQLKTLFEYKIPLILLIGYVVFFGIYYNRW